MENNSPDYLPNESSNGNAFFPPSQLTEQQIKEIILGPEFANESTLGDSTDGTAEWRICAFNENKRDAHYTFKNIPLLETMKKYCDKLGLSIENVRFKFKGNSIGVTDMQTTLPLDKDDIIEVVISD